MSQIWTWKQHLIIGLPSKIQRSALCKELLWSWILIMLDYSLIFVSFRLLNTWNISTCLLSAQCMAAHFGPELGFPGHSVTKFRVLVMMECKLDHDTMDPTLCWGGTPEANFYTYLSIFRCIAINHGFMYHTIAASSITKFRVLIMMDCKFNHDTVDPTLCYGGMPEANFFIPI